MLSYLPVKYSFLKTMGSLLAGEGDGYSSLSGSSGAGHGGSGGQGAGHTQVGRAYGSYLNPAAYGSSGGHSVFPHAGGRGGGILKLDVQHFLTVDGTISANGGKFLSPRSGGGSGGSIMIHTHVIDGDGSISVRGGKGESIWESSSHGGGGAGGRLALYFVQNYFVGELWGRGE